MAGLRKRGSDWARWTGAAESRARTCFSIWFGQSIRWGNWKDSLFSVVLKCWNGTLVLPDSLSEKCFTQGTSTKIWTVLSSRGKPRVVSHGVFLWLFLLSLQFSVTETEQVTITFNLNAVGSRFSISIDAWELFLFTTRTRLFFSFFLLVCW